MKKRILINASNLHSGGGVQVATSFIYEIGNLLERFSKYDLVIYVSSEVNLNLGLLGFDSSGCFDYCVFDVYGIRALNPLVAKRFLGFDLVFTIFGPLYLPWGIPNHIVGFAQSWILYPSIYSSVKLPFFKIFASRLKFFVQWLFFCTARRLVVELEHVKSRLVEYKGYPGLNVDVVYNCVSAIYYDKNSWGPSPLGVGGNQGSVKIGYVTRDYPHKNLDFLLAVKKRLSEVSKLNFEFYVTLTGAEWDRRSDDFKMAINNVGPLSIAQCPGFYQSMDGVIFPSLLESFSATPLEAMVMRKPLFASDRGFVRDCCGDSAIYFDPLDELDAAIRIDEWFSQVESSRRVNHLDKAYQRVLSMPNSRARANSYIDIIDKQIFG